MKRFCTVLLAIVMISASIVSYAHIEQTYQEEYSTVGSQTVSEGECLSMQMNLLVPANGMYLYTGSSMLECEAVICVYAWKDNIVDTLAQDPLYSETYTSWKSGDRIGIDFISKSGQPLEAGEYVLALRYNKGLNVSFNTYIPSRNFIKTYLDNFSIKGSLEGEIDFAQEAKKYFTETSNNVNYPYNTAGPEPTVAPDSTISEMNVDSTLWNCVDGLGRTLPGYDEVGDVKEDKVVGIFYWTWHTPSNSKGISNTKLSLEHPEMMTDYYNELWNTVGAGAHFWDEPLFGYYNEQDEYVLRKHAELLADAGIDFVAFDCTNGDNVWIPQMKVLLKVWSEAREQGINTPKVCCMLNFGYSENTLSSIKQLYEFMYKDGLYKDLWFYWDGKPLIIGWGSGLDDSIMEQAQYKEFFTFKQNIASYFEGDMSCDYWGWLHVYPQALYYKDNGEVEMTTVGISQNADYENMCLSAMNSGHNMGRTYTMQKNYSYSYTYRGKTIKVTKDIDNAICYGLNFQEQWDYAISKDPEMIFVTSWNEWTAGRYEEWCGVKNAFPDQYDAMNSRDAEPSKGILKDYYYYQLVANIRRFKGVSKPVGQTESVSIDINGDVSQWDADTIICYNHYTKNTYDRDVTMSFGNSYQNFTMRNDIVTAKVSYDSENVYFYVETVDSLTSSDDSKWMRLLLDTAVDTEEYNDWEGFEYIVNRVSPDSDGALLERSTGGWNWETVGKIQYTVQDNVLQLSIPRNYLGIDSGEFSFGFKWCDNNLDEDGDIMTLYTDGDAAPGGRYTFAFSTEEYKAKTKTNKTLIIVAAACVLALAALTITMVILKPFKRVSKKNEV